MKVAGEKGTWYPSTEQREVYPIGEYGVPNEKGGVDSKQGQCIPTNPSQGVFVLDCDEAELNCMDPSATNYNPAATTQDPLACKVCDRKDASNYDSRYLENAKVFNEDGVVIDELESHQVLKPEYRGTHMVDGNSCDG